MNEKAAFIDDIVRIGEPEAANTLMAAAGRAIAWIGDPSSDRPRSDVAPGDLDAQVRALDICPPAGAPVGEVLERLAEVIFRHGVVPSAPATAAHLQVPTLIASAAAELCIAAANQSMDSWDQAPAATSLELHLMDWLASELGLGSAAGGVMTPGGTSSNLLALTLARARAASSVGVDIGRSGLPEEARHWRILASEGAHFSVQRAASQLGLGRERVVSIGTDRYGRMDIDALDVALTELARERQRPIAIVATAGTTDAGAVDPLAAMGRRARQARCWFHVDAAVGGAFVLSDRLRPLLNGIEHADSVTVDFHKLWFQPIGASALVVADQAAFDLVRVPSAYLDRGDEPSDVVNLVGRSLDTSRRFDAAKVVAGLASVGRRRMASMIEHLFSLALVAADEVDRSPYLELAREPSTVTCLFRPASHDKRDAGRVQAALLRKGAAVIGRTMMDGQQTLKLTFVNPTATPDDIRSLVRTIVTEVRSGRNST